MFDRAMQLHPGIRFIFDDRPTPVQDRRGHTRPMLKITVGGIYDSIRYFTGYITLDQLQDLTGREPGLCKKKVHRNILPP